MASENAIQNAETMPTEEERDSGMPISYKRVVVKAETDPLFDQYFMKANGAPTLTSAPTAVDDYTVTVDLVTTFNVGDILFLASGIRFYTAGILSIAGNVLTLDTPLDYIFPTGTVAISMTNNLAVNGSVTKQTFIIQSGEGLIIDVHRILVTMLSTTPMDDGKFGGIPALTNGLVMRFADGTYRNIASAKKNSDFRVFAYDVEYLSKAPAGQYGMGVRFTFGGEDKHGSIIRVGPTDRIEIIVQDDLTGLDELLITAQGHLII